MDIEPFGEMCLFVVACSLQPFDVVIHVVDNVLGCVYPVPLWATRRGRVIPLAGAALFSEQSVTNNICDA